MPSGPFYLNLLNQTIYNRRRVGGGGGGDGGRRGGTGGVWLVFIITMF